MTTWAERAEAREDFERDNRAKIVTDLDYALNCAAVEIDTTNARAELASLRATVVELEAQNAQLQAVIALNKYVTPPFDLMDDDTVRLALECVTKDERISALVQAVNEAREVISSYKGGFVDGCTCKWCAWLAAHPAPEEVTQ
jgi:hypothetical protein